MIYESACGIGLNLFMTLEIIQEAARQTAENITIYGNEYVAPSAEIARQLADANDPDTFLFKSVNGRLGSICTADSMNLSAFVPADTFDIVYTGYITPMLDPLQLNGTVNDNFRQYGEHCEKSLRTAEDDSSINESKKLAKLAQERQNDWYWQWVGEMIRIAKPGAPIIIEQVFFPLCEAIFDWGGVAPTFWKGAVRKYDWDVERSSIEMEDDTIFRRRYQVFMRKNI
jgi:hypothetical protein